MKQEPIWNRRECLFWINQSIRFNLPESAAAWTILLIQTVRLTKGRG